MQRIDKRTVILTKTEDEMHDLFNDALSDGHGIEDAARLILNDPKYRMEVTAAFASYLSDGTLSWDYGTRATKKHPVVPGRFDRDPVRVHGCCTACGATEVLLNKVSGRKIIDLDGLLAHTYPVGYGCEVCN